jgi:DNA-binding GntR family transcriptional regulator
MRDFDNWDEAKKYACVPWGYRGWIGHADILRAIQTRQPAKARQAKQVHIDDLDKMIQLFGR